MNRLVLLPCCALLVACSDIGDPPGTHASCTFNQNSTWQDSDLILDHDDDRDCPFGADVGDPVSTAGTIYDLSLTYPNFIGDGNAYRMYLSAHDGSTGGGSGPWSFSGTFTVRDELFAWGTPHNGGAGFEWQATESISWDAGESPDFGLFQVEWGDYEAYWGEARMTIPYWGEEM